MLWKFFPAFILFGVLLYVFTLVHVDLFFWKDGQKFERMVVTTNSKESRTDYAPYPNELKDDSRIEHREGLVGLGTYGFEKIQECIPQSEEENAENSTTTVQIQAPPRTHSVGKLPVQEDSSANPALSEVPESAAAPISVPVSTLVGTQASGSAMKEYPLEQGMKIPRVYEDPNSILTASFNIDPWYPRHMGYAELLDDLLVVLAQFDLTAVQGMYMENTDMLRQIITELSRRTGQTYSYAVILPKNRSKNDPVPVFFYDMNTVEMDPATLRLVGKPNMPFGFPPLAAKFRVKKAEADKAFTFLAVNYSAFQGCEAQEIQNIPNVINALKDANATGVFEKEDDVIIMGHFGMHPNSVVIGDSGFNASLTWADPEMPTNTFGKFSFVSENILFQSAPLSEFSAMSGVWDLRRQYHRAKGIPFDHHPVWARFGIYEGQAE